MPVLDRSLSVLVSFDNFKPDPYDLFDAIFLVIGDPSGLLCLQPLSLTKFEITLYSSSLANQLIDSGLTLADVNYPVSPTTDPGLLVRIRNLPYQFPDSKLLDHLKRYGRILSDVMWEKWRGGFDFCNGTRKIRIQLSKPIPEVIFIDNFKCNIFYPGIIRNCHLCKGTDHLKASCPNQIGNSSTPPSEPKLLTANMDAVPPPSPNIVRSPSPSIQPISEDCTPPPPLLTPITPQKNSNKSKPSTGLKPKGFAFVRASAEELPPRENFYAALNERVFSKVPSIPEAQSYIFKSRPAWTELEVQILQSFASLGPERFKSLAPSFKSYWTDVELGRYLEISHPKGLNTRARNALPVLYWDSEKLKLTNSGLGHFNKTQF